VRVVARRWAAHTASHGAVPAVASAWLSAPASRASATSQPAWWCRSTRQRVPRCHRLPRSPCRCSGCLPSSGRRRPDGATVPMVVTLVLWWITTSGNASLASPPVPPWPQESGFPATGARRRWALPRIPRLHSQALPRAVSSATRRQASRRWSSSLPWPPPSSRGLQTCCATHGRHPRSFWKRLS
jgi:hypothetical protein